MGSREVALARMHRREADGESQLAGRIIQDGVLSGIISLESRGASRNFTKVFIYRFDSAPLAACNLRKSRKNIQVRGKF